MKKWTYFSAVCATLIAPAVSMQARAVRPIPAMALIPAGSFAMGDHYGKLQRKADFGWPGGQDTRQTARDANGYGLYDRAPNVWQWCPELYEQNYGANSPAANPPGPAEGSPMRDGKVYRAMRGGNWFNGEFGHSRVSNRDPSYFRGLDRAAGRSDADGPWFHIGLRLVRPTNAEGRPMVRPTAVPLLVSQERGPGGERPANPRAQGGGGGRGVRLLPRNAEDQLNLTEQQRRQIADLEKEVSARLAGILTPAQQKILNDAQPPRRPEGGTSEDRPPRPVAAPPAAQDSDAYSRKPNGSFVLRSSAVPADGTLPKEFTGDGAGVSPPLDWSGAPAGTTSYALIVHHTDPQGQNISYWIVYDIPAGVHSLPRAATGIGSVGISSRGHRVGYTPFHSQGPGAKTYVFTVYALSAPPHISVAPSEVSQEILLAAMKDKILASADLRVTYTR